jgi:N-methylhydantoinase B/oxoprolinase/acetone carboxylase alpha subunit
MADIWVGIIGTLGVVAVAFITAWTTINSAKIKAKGDLEDALTKARHSALEDQAAFRKDLMASLAGCNSRCEELKKIIEAKELQIIDLSKRVWALESRLDNVKRIHTN